MWAVIHMCMETTQGISLYSYLHLKLQKYHVFLIIFYVFSSTKSENKRVEQVLPGGGGREVGSPNNVHTCTHVIKCKDNKITLKKLSMFTI
jgi:hypothetical protein